MNCEDFIFFINSRTYWVHAMFKLHKTCFYKSRLTTFLFAKWQLDMETSFQGFCSFVASLFEKNSMVAPKLSTHLWLEMIAPYKMLIIIFVTTCYIYIYRHKMYEQKWFHLHPLPLLWCFSFRQNCLHGYRGHSLEWPSWLVL